MDIETIQRAITALLCEKYGADFTDNYEVTLQDVDICSIDVENLNSNVG